MKTRSILIGLSSLLGLSLCSGIFGAKYSNEAKEANAASSTAVYTVASVTSVTTSGVAPEGSSATFKNTYSTQDQMTSGNSMTLTLSGYQGCTITGLKLSMHSNSKKGAGTFSTVAGSTSIASVSAATTFDKWYDNKSFGTDYRDVTVELTNNSYEIKNNENLVITITGTANSLYCQSFSIAYEKNAEPVYATGITLASDLDGKTFYNTTKEVRITPTITPDNYNGKVAYEFSDPSMDDIATLKTNDDGTCSVTPKKAGIISVIGKVNSGADSFLQSEPLTLTIVEDKPVTLNVSGQKQTFSIGEKFSFGDNASIEITRESGIKESLSEEDITIKLDDIEISSTKELDLTDDGKSIVIEYFGLTCTYKINVLDAPAYSYSFASKQYSNVGETIVLNKIRWTYTAEGNPTYYSYEAARGQQFGSKSNPAKTVILSSEHFINSTTPEKSLIKRIDVNASTASGTSATLEVKVNNIQIGETKALTTSASAYSFETEEPVFGIVEISISNSGKAAIYIKSIDIYTSQDDGTASIFNSLANDISSINTCAIESNPDDFISFLEKGTDLGTYEEIIDAYREELSSLMILDYSYADYVSNKNSYSGINKTTYISVIEKYDALENYYLNSTSKANVITSPANNSIAIATVASLLGVLSISTFVILKRKRA